jgi:DNA-binding GntR family transcriptional regulator
MEALASKLVAKNGLASEIASTIRNLILNGELKPGDRIIESRVARQLGVGQPTVREALVELEHQGLVSRKPNHGCFVTTLTRAEIADILRIRSDMETLAVELAIENASTEDINSLLELAREMVEIAKSGNARLFHSRDQVFHETLWKITGNSCLPRVLEQVMMPLLAFLFIRNVQEYGKIDLAKSAKAHVAIAESIMNRDKANARVVAKAAFAMFSEQHLNMMDNYED